MHFHLDSSILLLDILQCQKIINDHIDHRRVERLQEPTRFDIKPSIGERCVRKPIPTQAVSDETEDEKVAGDGGEMAPPGREQSEYGSVLLSFFLFDQTVHPWGLFSLRGNYKVQRDNKQTDQNLVQTSCCV